MPRFTWGRWLRSLFRSRPKTYVKKPRRVLSLEQLESRLAPATYTWSGGGGNALWSNAGNWLNGAAPLFTTVNDNLVFNSTPGAALRSTTDDITTVAGTSNAVDVGTISISGDNYTIAGSAGVTLTIGSMATGGGLLNVTGLNALISLPFQLGGPAVGSANDNISVGPSGSLTVSGKLIGAAGTNLIFNGSGNANGTMVLSADNGGAGGFNGSVAIDAGVLSITHANALGNTLSANNTTTVLTGATLQVDNSGASMTNATPINEPVLLNGIGAANQGALYYINGGANNKATWAGNITLGTDVTIGDTSKVANAQGTLTISGVISDNGIHNLTKIGTGEIILSAANTYRGATFINNGMIAIQNNWALGHAPIGAGSSNADNLPDTGTFINHDITTTGTLLIDGAGAPGGGITISNQLLTINNPTFGNGSPGNYGPDGSVLDNISGNNTWAGEVILPFDNIFGNIGVFGQINRPESQNSSLTIGGISGVTNTPFTGFSGTITGATGAGVSPIVFTTPSTANLTTGESVHISGVGGETQVNATNQVIKVDDATHFELVGGPAGNGTFSSNGTWQLGPVSGPAGITKVGNGLLILTGGNPFKGSTSVTSGVVEIENSGALGRGGSNISVSNGATLELSDDFQLANNIAPLNRLTIPNTIGISGNGWNIGGGSTLGALYSKNGINTWLGQVSLNGSAAIGVDPAANATGSPYNYDISNTGLVRDDSLMIANDGQITGGGATLTKVANGQLILPTDNSYTGATDIKQGWITIETTAALGQLINGVGLGAQSVVTVENGAALHLLPLAAAPVDEDQTIVFNGTIAANATFTIGSVITTDSTNPISWNLNPATIASNIQAAINARNVVSTYRVTGGTVQVKWTGGTYSGGVATNLTFDVLFNGGTLAKTFFNTFTVSNPAGASGSATMFISQAGSAGNMTLKNKLTLSGNGINFVNPTTNLAYYPLVDGQGALMSLAGSNFVTGYTTLNGQVGIGVEQIFSTDVSSVNFDPFDNVPTQLTLQGPIFDGTSIGGSAGGINKLGSQRLIIQAPGTYIGPVNVNQGVLLDQNSTGLGLGGAATNGVTVQSGAALELANGTFAENGGIIAGMDVQGIPLTLYGTGDPLFGDNAPLNVLPASDYTLPPVPASVNGNWFSSTSGPSNDPVITTDNLWGGNVNLGTAITVTFRNALGSVAQPTLTADVTGLTIPLGGTPASAQIVTTNAGGIVPGVSSSAGNAVQAITFGGSINGGTFKLNYNGKITAPITWSSNPLTLANNIELALIAAGVLNTSAANLLVAPVAASLISVPSTNSGTGRLTLAGNISDSSPATLTGGVDLIQIGGGELALAGTNTLKGTVVTSSGVLTVENGQALGNSGNAGEQTLALFNPTTNPPSGNATQFTLTFNNGTPTSTITYTGNPLTDAANIQSALNLVLGAGNSVTVNPAAEIPGTAAIFDITFGGGLANTTLPLSVSVTSPAGTGSAVVVKGGGTAVANGASLQFQGDLTVAGEPMVVQGNGVAATPNVPMQWFPVGPAPINGGQTGGNPTQPVTGRINGIAVDPTDSKTVYIATAGGGAWKTINGGQTWQPIFDAIPDVQTITVNLPLNPLLSASYTLTYNGATTNSLPNDADAATVQAALDSLSTIGGVGGLVTVTQSQTPTGIVTFTVTFGGALAGQLVSKLVATGTNVVVNVAVIENGFDSLDTVQSISLVGLGAADTFILTFGGLPTGSLASNVPASGGVGPTASVQNALQGLANIGVGNVKVTGSPGGPYTVHFVGTLGGKSQPTISGSTTAPFPATIKVALVQTGGIFPSALFTGAIILDPGSPQTIYLGTGDTNDAADTYYGTGLYKSTDSGVTWSLVLDNSVPGSPINPFYRQGISQIIESSGVLFVASGQFNVVNGITTTSPGVWRFQGGVWSNLTSVVSTTRSSVPSTNAADVTPGATPFPSTPGPDDDYRITFPQSNMTWTSIGIGRGATDPFDAAGADGTDGQEIPILYAALGTAQGNAANGVYWTNTPFASPANMQWYQGNPYVGSISPAGTELGPVLTPDAESAGEFSIISGVWNNYNGPHNGLPNGDNLFGRGVNGNIKISVVNGGSTTSTNNVDIDNGGLGPTYTIFATVASSGSAFAPPTGYLSNIYSSTDGGNDWAAIGNPGNYMNVNSIGSPFGGEGNYSSSILALNTNTVYIGSEANNATSQAGQLWVTNNAGASWTDLANDSGYGPHTSQHVIVRNPTTGALYFGGDGGIWQLNSANNWSDFNGNLEISQINGLASNPGDTSTLYAGSQSNGISKYTGSTAWKMVDPLNGNGAIGEMGGYQVFVDPTNANNIYAAETALGPAAPGIIRGSKDGGATWSTLLSGLPSSPPLVVDPVNSQRLLVGGAALDESTSGPNSNNFTWSSLNAPIGVSAIAAAQYQGNFQADNFLQGTTQYASSVIAFSSQYTNTVWSAAQALGAPNTFAYGDITTAWAALNTDGPPNPEFLDLRYTIPVNATGVTVRETNDNGFVTRIDLVDTANVYHTVFGPGGTDPSQPGTPVNFTVTFPQTLYLVKGVKVYVNPLHVVNDWEEIDSVALLSGSQDVPLPSDQGADAYVPGTIYITNGTKIDVTENHGNNWHDISIPGNLGSIAQLVVDPNNSYTVYAVRSTFGGQEIWKSTDAGQDWSDITSNLPVVPAWSLVLDPRNGNLYVGNDSGIYMSNNGGSSWAPFGTGLPNVSVHNLQLNQVTNQLLAGTYGRSVFALTLDSTPGLQQTITLSNPKQATTKFNLTFNSVASSPDITYSGDPGTDATAIQKALNGLTSISSLGYVRVSANAADTVFTVSFYAGLGGTTLPVSINITSGAGTGSGVVTPNFPTNYQGGGLTATSGSSTFTGPIQLSGPTTIGALGTGNLQNGISAAQLNIVGSISDLPGTGAGNSNSLYKTGLGNVVLAGANTYAGVTTVQQGALIVSNSQALGQSGAGQNTIVTAGAELDLESNLDLEPITLNGDGAAFNGHFDGALHNISNNNTYTGTITLATSSTIGVNSGTTLTIGDGLGNGTIIDNLTGRSLVKELTGTLVYNDPTSYGAGGPATYTLALDQALLPGAVNPVNTFPSGTIVAQGVLNIQNDSALSTNLATTTVLDQAQLQIQGGITVPSTQSLRLTGTGILNTGAMENVGGNNTWLGDITLAEDPGFNLTSIPANNVAIDVLGINPSDTLTLGGTIGTLTSSITGATNPASPNPIVIQTASTAGLATGDQVIITGVNGNTAANNTSANPAWTIIVDDATHFELVGSTGNAAFTSSPQATWQQVLGLSVNLGGSTDALILNPTSGNNTFNGQTTVYAGALRIQQNGALGNTTQFPVGGGFENLGTVVNSGASLQLDGALGQLDVSTETVTLNGPGFNKAGALEDYNDFAPGIPNIWESPVILATDSAVGADPAMSMSITGQIQNRSASPVIPIVTSAISPNALGAPSLAKVGTGTVILDPSSASGNPYTGATYVNAGALNVPDSKALGFPNVNQIEKVTVSGPPTGLFNLTFEGQQTVNLPNNVAAGIANISNASEAPASTTVTISTSSQHGFKVGQSVTIANVGAGYDGTFMVTGAPTPTTFTYTAAVSGLGNVSPASGSARVNGTGNSLLNALEALPNIGAGNVAVTGNAGGPYTITFQNALGGTTLPALYPFESNGTIFVDITRDGAHDTMVNPTVVQTVTVTNGVNGTFTLDFNGKDTAALDVTSPTLARDIQTALNNLTNINGIASITATGANEVGTTVTITTSAAHNFFVGEPVQISGVGVNGYNGLYTITAVPTPTSFTYTASIGGLAASGGGTATVSGSVGVSQSFDALSQTVFTVTFGGSLAQSVLPPLTWANVTGAAAAVIGTVGASLQVQGTITFNTEPLTLVGMGYNNAGALENLSGTNTWASPITLAADASIGADSASTLIVTGVIADGGSAFGVTKVGAGIVQYAAATSNTYTGLTKVIGGTLQLNSAGIAVAGDLTIGDNTSAAVADVAQLEAASQLVVTSTVTVNSDGKFDLNGNAQTVQALKMTGGLVDLTPVGSQLTVPSITASSADSSTNPALGATKAAANIIDPGAIATLILSGVNPTITVNGPGPATPADLVISAVLGGTSGFTKDGPGTLQLTSDSAGTLTGTTTIKAGTLLADGPNAGNTLGTVALNGGTLGGVGTVGAISNGGNGTVAPGDNAAGTLGVGSGVTLNTNTTLNVTLDYTGATASSILNVTGLVDLNGAHLTANIVGTPAIGTTFTIVQATSPIANTFTLGLPGILFVNLPSGTIEFQVNYNPGGANTVTLTQIAITLTNPTIITPSPIPAQQTLLGTQLVFNYTAKDGTANFPANQLTVTSATSSNQSVVSNANIVASAISNLGNGSLTITPTTTGIVTITFVVADPYGLSVTGSFQFTVGTAPAITSANNTTFIVGTAGSFQMVATGFPAPTFTKSGVLPGGVTLSNTGLLSGTPNATTGGVYNITVTASNGFGSNATQAFKLTVNEAPNITSANSAIFSVGYLGSFTVKATGFPAPTYTESGALPGGVVFNTNTGLLRGTPAVGSEGTYNLVFTASNGVGTPATQNFTLTVGVAPTFTSANNVTFIVGTAGTFTLAANGVPPPTFTESGALPGGVTFAAGVLSGTPAAGSGGVYNLTFTASNGAQPDATQNFTLTVDQAPAITSLNSATFVVGTAGSFTVVASGYPAPAFSVSGALPGGVSLSPTTGVLSGTPAAGSGGVYNLTFTAANGVGSNATQPFTLTVNQAPAITSANKITFTVGASGTFTVTKTGLPSPTLSESGLLPSGVTFVPATGILSGTPAALTGGTYNLVFTASNGVGANATQNFTLTVNQAPAITSPNSKTFTVGSAGTFNVTATGFPVPTFTESGALPGGVTLTAAGLLSGTPAANTGATYNIIITASNGVGANATQNFTLTVNQAPAITSGNSTTFTVGSAGTFTVTATGFPNPTFTTSGLPSGVTLTAAGLLSGTPAAATGGTYNLVITASNGVGTNATQNFTLTVNQAPAITSLNSATFAVGSPGTFTVIATGFPAPTFTESGALPGGVTLSAAGLLSGTPTASGTFNIVITATNGISPNATQNFTLTVNQAPAITSVAGATFTTGSAGTFTVMASGVPAPTFTESGALPSGVTLSAAGLLSGTPGATTGGIYNLVITATNSAGTATQNFTLTVNQLPAFTSAASTTFSVGFASSFNVTASGFPVPTLSVSGTMPAGVTFNATSGLLSGTPTGAAGNFNLTFSAHNSAGTKTQAFVLTIAPALAFSPALTNKSYSHTVGTVNLSGAANKSGVVYALSITSSSPAVPGSFTASIDTGTGAITITGFSTYAGTVNFKETATLGPNSINQTFAVTFTNNIPVLNPIADQTMGHGTTKTLTLSYSDLDTPTDTLTPTFSAAPYSQLYNLQQQLNLYVAGTPSNPYFFNLYKKNEKWLKSHKDGNWYALVVVSGNTYVYAFTGSPVNPFGTLKGIFPGTSLYTNPLLLVNAAPPPPVNVTFSFNPTTKVLSMTPVSATFTGQFQVTVNLSDGITSVSKMFVVTVT